VVLSDMTLLAAILGGVLPERTTVFCSYIEADGNYGEVPVLICGGGASLHKCRRRRGRAQREAGPGQLTSVASD